LAAELALHELVVAEFFVGQVEDCVRALSDQPVVSSEPHSDKLWRDGDIGAAVRTGFRRSHRLVQLPVRQMTGNALGLKCRAFERGRIKLHAAAIRTTRSVLSAATSRSAKPSMSVFSA